MAFVDKGFSYQMMAFEFFLAVQDSLEPNDSFLEFFAIDREYQKDEQKIITNTLAKHLDEFSRLNIYSQTKILQQLRQGNTLKSTYGHLLKLARVSFLNERLTYFCRQEQIAQNHIIYIMTFKLSLP